MIAKTKQLNVIKEEKPDMNLNMIRGLTKIDGIYISKNRLKKDFKSKTKDKASIYTEEELVNFYKERKYPIKINDNTVVYVNVKKFKNKKKVIKFYKSLIK
jgi:hypothetical protein